MYRITIVLAAFSVAAVKGHSNCVGCDTKICGENEVPVRGHARRDRFCRPAITPHELFSQLRMCICKPHYVRNSWNECIPRKHCRRCRSRLQKDWHLCSSACPVTSNLIVPFCRNMCVPGCDCPPDWVVDSRNWKRCVKAAKYPPVCPPHSRYESCVSTCAPSCGFRQPTTCVTICHRGACVCDKGFAEIWTDNGKICVPLEKCDWYIRNLLTRNGTIINGVRGGVLGGVGQSGGLVMGPGGALVPGAMGLLPFGAGMLAGGASLLGTGGTGGTSVSVRGGGTSVTHTGGSGVSGAGSSTGIVNSHGVGGSIPIGISSAAGVSSSGTTGNGMGGVRVGSVGGSIGSNGGVGGLGAGLGGGGTPISISTGTRGGHFGFNTGGVRVPGIAVSLPTSAVTTASGMSTSHVAGTTGPIVAVNPAGASLGGAAGVTGVGNGVHSPSFSLTTGSHTGSLGSTATSIHAPGGGVSFPAGAGSPTVGSTSPIATGAGGLSTIPDQLPSLVPAYTEQL
nr:PE-PGRS family protein PE_PGRS33-like [Dermacentor andersoni]